MSIKGGRSIPIVVTVTNNTWTNVTSQVRARITEEKLKQDAYYLIGAHSRGYWDAFLSFSAFNDDKKAFSIPAKAQWDNQGVVSKVLKEQFFVRSTNATGDDIELILIPYEGQA